MNSDELIAIFDRQASGYDHQGGARAAIEAALHATLPAVFREVPDAARLLCVGVGTGKEVIYLAKRFPQWRFTLVEPSAGMMSVCRQNLTAEGLAERCAFHNGYLDSLSGEAVFDAATCFLVSQFLVAEEARTGFFRQLAERLKTGGILASSDLTFNTAAPDYESMLALWFGISNDARPTQQDLDRLKATYSKDVDVIPMSALAQLVEAAGFETPLPFFQAGLIRAWCARVR